MTCTPTPISPTACPLWRSCRRGPAATRSALLRHNRPREEPADAADDRRQDAGPAQCRQGARSRATMVLLHGTELNIDPDGEVDWDADFLSGFDICVAVDPHSLRAVVRDQTRRLIRACENPYVNIIGHPTTRQIGRRGPIDAGLGRGLRSGRAHRHRHGNQQPPRPARPQRRTGAAGQAPRRRIRCRTPTRTPSATWTISSTASVWPNGHGCRPRT